MRQPTTNSRRRGAVTVLTALLLLVFIAMVAFAVDLAYIVLVRTQLQNAADAAVLAAVQDLSTSQDQARSTAIRYAGLHSAGAQSVAVTNGDVVVGNWSSASRTFRANATPFNAVQLTASRSGSNALDLFFGSALQKPTADVSARAIAAALAVNEAEVVPMALRNNQSFGPIDPDVLARNPGKDGPSYPTHPYPEHPQASFEIGDEVTVAIYGKGAKPSLHLTLTIYPNPADAHKALEGQDGYPLPLAKLGDEYTVFNDGTGSSAFIESLDDRVERLSPSDPKRTVIVPIVETTATSRNESGQLIGKVRVVEYLAVYLERIEEFDYTETASSSSSTTRDRTFARHGRNTMFFAAGDNGNGNSGNDNGNGNDGSSTDSGSSSSGNSGNGNGSGGSSDGGSSGDSSSASGNDGGNGNSSGQGTTTLRRLIGRVVTMRVQPRGTTRDASVIVPTPSVQAVQLVD